MTKRWPRLGDSGLQVAQVWVASRLVMVLVGVWLMTGNGWSFSQLVGRWDVLHFIAIAQHGYADLTSAAFFPGLPLLLRGGAAIGLPMTVSGVLVALITSALAAAALYRLFGAAAATWWLVAPTAIFTAVGYSEAPFCAAAFWAWYKATKGHDAQAAVLAGVACAFRISGLFLVAGLAVAALTKPGRELPRLVWLVIPVAVLAVFEVYLHGVTGSWTAWLDAQQQGWTRGFSSPWASLMHTVQAGLVSSWPGRLDIAWVFRAEIVSMAVGLAVTIWALWRRRWAWATFTGLQVVAFGTSCWYMSVNRAVLVWFPLWAGLGAATKRARSIASRAVTALAGVVSLGLMVTWAWLFMTGRWAS